MADMTGFNTTQAQAQLEAFKEAYEEAGKILNNAFYNFQDELRTKWYSPKAVEFYSSYIGVRTKVWNSKTRTFWTIMNNAIGSYNILARSNGEAEMENPYSRLANATILYSSGDHADVEFSERSPEGAVGMNTLLVKNVVIPLFKESIAKSISAFESLPLDIAFYDPAGELKASFKEMIVKMTEVITTEVDSLLQTVNEALGTEIENITIAKESAAETLSA